MFNKLKMLTMKDRLILIIILLFIISMIQDYYMVESFSDKSKKSRNAQMEVSDDLKNILLTNKSTIEEILENPTSARFWKGGVYISKTQIKDWHKIFTTTNSKTGALECKSGGVAGKQSKYEICNRSPEYKGKDDKYKELHDSQCVSIIGDFDKNKPTSMNFALCEHENIPVLGGTFMHIFNMYTRLKLNLLSAKSKHETYMFDNIQSDIFAFRRALVHYYCTVFSLTHPDKITNSLELEKIHKIYISIMSRLFYKELSENESKRPILAFIKIWNIMHNIKRSKELMKEILTGGKKNTYTEIILRSEFEINKYNDTIYLSDNNQNDYNYIDEYITKETKSYIREKVDEILTSTPVDINNKK
jgi:hypothetical protein